VFSRASNSHEARRAAYEHIMGLAAGRIGA
jgi:hypothetical protein